MNWPTDPDEAWERDLLLTLWIERHCPGRLARLDAQLGRMEKNLDSLERLLGVRWDATNRRMVPLQSTN